VVDDAPEPDFHEIEDGMAAADGIQLHGKSYGEHAEHTI